MNRIIIVLIFSLFLASCGGRSKTRVYSHEAEKDSMYLKNFMVISETFGIDDLVKIIDKRNCVLERFIGTDGHANESYACFLKLERIASDSMLVELTKHKNPVVGIYSYRILKNRKSKLVSKAVGILKDKKGEVCQQTVDMIVYGPVEAFIESQ